MNERNESLDRLNSSRLYILPTIVDDFQEEKRLFAEEAAEMPFAKLQYAC